MDLKLQRLYTTESQLFRKEKSKTKILIIMESEDSERTK